MIQGSHTTQYRGHTLHDTGVTHYTIQGSHTTRYRGHTVHDTGGHTLHDTGVTHYTIQGSHTHTTRYRGHTLHDTGVTHYTIQGSHTTQYRGSLHDTGPGHTHMHLQFFTPSSKDMFPYMVGISRKYLTHQQSGDLATPSFNLPSIRQSTIFGLWWNESSNIVCMDVCGQTSSCSGQFVLEEEQQVRGV